MEVIINNQSISFPEGSLLKNVLQYAGINQYRGIAVAVNNNIIPQSEWSSKPLNDNDKITIIKASQGG